MDNPNNGIQPPQLPLLMVEWYDHYGSRDYPLEWRPKGEIQERTQSHFILRSIGQLVWEDDTRICLCAHERPKDADGNALYSNYQVIYKALIISQAELMEVSPASENHQDGQGTPDFSATRSIKT